GAGGRGGGVREVSEVVVFLFGDCDARGRDIPRGLIVFKSSAEFFAAFCLGEHSALGIVTDRVIAGGKRLALLFLVGEVGHMLPPELGKLASVGAGSCGGGVSSAGLSPLRIRPVYTQATGGQNQP